MPRVSETVSENVFLVPKPTNFRMSASIRCAEGAFAISYMRGSKAGGVCASRAVWHKSSVKRAIHRVIRQSARWCKRYFGKEYGFNFFQGIK